MGPGLSRVRAGLAILSLAPPRLLLVVALVLGQALETARGSPHVLALSFGHDDHIIAERIAGQPDVWAAQVVSSHVSSLGPLDGEVLGGGQLHGAHVVFQRPLASLDGDSDCVMVASSSEAVEVSGSARLCWVLSLAEEWWVGALVVLALGRPALRPNWARAAFADALVASWRTEVGRALDELN